MDFQKIVCERCATQTDVAPNVLTIRCPACGHIIEIPPPPQQKLPFDAGRALAMIETMVNSIDDKHLNANAIMKHFTAENYPFSFKLYQPEFTNTLKDFASLYSEPDSDLLCRHYGKLLIGRVLTYIKDHPEKGQPKNYGLYSVSMLVTTYMIPSILAMEAPFSDALADGIVAEWNRAYPRQKIKKGTFDALQTGFYKRWCFITTAVCESLHKPDDCEELTALRHFRDTYLLRQPEGPLLIQQYYLFAPMLVACLDRQPNAPALYRSLWQRYLLPCLLHLQASQPESCKRHYMRMISSLRKRFF